MQLDAVSGLLTIADTVRVDQRRGQGNGEGGRVRMHPAGCMNENGRYASTVHSGNEGT